MRPLNTKQPSLTRTMDKRSTDDDYTTSASAVANIRYDVGAADFRSPKRTSQRFSGLIPVVFILIAVSLVVLIANIWSDSAPEHRLNERAIYQLDQ